MKLFEILNKTSPNIKSTNKPVDTNKLFNKHNIPFSQGFQATTTQHNKFPNSITKHINIHNTNDPQYQFIKLALKHQNNPFFPKIFSAKLYNNPNPSYIDDNNISPQQPGFNKVLIITMEKLFPIHINQQTLIDFNIHNIFTTDHNKPWTNQPHIQFRRAFNDPNIRKHIQHSTNNKFLKQALRLLEPLFNHYDPDVHQDNIMQRLNNHFVFIDPISHKEHDLPQDYKKWMNIP